jgi:hypothetical protein
MGLETAILIGGLQLAKGVGEYNQAKSSARATAREGEIAVENRKKEIMQLVAKQKVGYIQSGVELEGTAQAVMQDTYNTGIADMEAIAGSYNQNIKNSLRAARAQLLGSIANAGVSAYSFYSMSGASGLENMAGQSSGWNPAVSAPVRKPV